MLIWVKLIYSFPYFYHCSSLFSANIITVHMICFHFLLLSFALFFFAVFSRSQHVRNWNLTEILLLSWTRHRDSEWRPSLSFWNQNTTLWLMSVINRHQEGFLTCLRVRFNSHSGSPCVRCYLIVEAKTSLQIRKYINLINSQWSLRPQSGSSWNFMEVAQRELREFVSWHSFSSNQPTASI